jgi:cystathionine beta-lyase
MVKSDGERPARRPATRLTRAGRDKSLTGPFVNPPVFHASTVLFESVDDMLGGRQRYVYGRRGTPTIEALETAITELEGAAGTIICPSGLNAAATALLACLASGDHVLVTDSVYEPIRRLLDRTLASLGIAATYFDPRIAGGVEALLRPNTRAVYVESPGSLTFEMQDIPAIAAAAAKRDILVIADNTWATPLYFPALKRGADLSVLSGTKHIGGHSDLMLGLVSANDRAWSALKRTHGDLGLCAGPDDINMALRGLRTLAIRLERSAASGEKVARWLSARREVARVLFPVLESDPGHALWRRDMTGACGLFSVVLDGWSETRVKAFVDALTLFGIGASWGGYESLVSLARPEKIRTAVPWRAEGPLVRFYVGLEDPADLIADLDAAFAQTADVG